MSVAMKTIRTGSRRRDRELQRQRDVQNLRRPVAPSIAVASSTSCGIDAMPARKITVANGMVRQACTVMIDDIAARGVPSQVG